MTDISALGIKITSSGVVKTIKELQDFSKAASEVRKQASKPISVKLGNTGIAKAIGEIDRLKKALSGVTGKDLSGTVQLAQAMSKIEIANNKAAISAQKLAQEVARTEVAQSKAAAAASNLAAANAKADVSLAKTAVAAQKLASAQEAAASASNASMNQIKNNLTAMNLAANSMKQADAHIQAYRNSLNSIAPAAQKAGDSVQKMNARLNDSANNMQATPGNIAAQFQDIGVTAAMGMSPLLIALQQGTQLSAAFAGGGLKQLGTAFKQLISPVSLLTIGIVALIAYIVQLAMEMVRASNSASSLQKSLDNAKLSTNAFGDAQSILGGILDLTTGKVKDQSDAFVALARAQTAQAKIQAEIRQQEADAQLKSISREKTFIGGGPVGLQVTRGYEYAAGVVDTFRSGGYSKDSGQNADRAIKQLERMLELGQLTKAEYLEAAAAVSNYSVETENIKTYDLLADAINGNKDAIKGFLNENEKKDKASERLAERLAREAEATETLIKGNYASADAYRASTAEGIKAAVAAEAAAKGIKAQGEAAAYSARELRKWVSEQARSAEENNASLREQIQMQQFVNKAVSEGTLSVENASIALQNMAEQRKILNAIQVAKLNGDTKGEEALRKALKELTDQQIAYNAAVREAADLSATNDVNKNIIQIQKEIDLEKRLGNERIKALRGLTGDALENELARINDERERGAILLEYEAKIADASAAGHYELVKALEAERKKRLELLGIQQGSAKEERTFEQNRRLTLNLANDVANLIGGKLGDTFNRLIKVLDEAFTDLDADLGEKFCHIFKAFSEGMKTGGAFGALTGSRTGGAIGGGLGQVVGESIAPMLGKLGSFAGPLGAIAGGILGGVIGGLVKKTPRASATVSIIAGEAMETAIKGSSDKLKKAAGQMANGIIDGLTSLADQLGAQLIGDATVSIGMRKKNYRVDPTGQGITKTSKGAIDFGEDQAAAIAYAMQVAIQQGVLGGLSESMKRLIMADGDLQTQISKALSFKGVFDELAQNDDPAKWAQDEITRWRENMDKIFKEAGATADELAELERLTGIKRAKAAEEAAEKIAQAEREALDRQREIRDKNIELLEAQGKIEEAEAMARQARIDDAPEYLRSIQQQIEAALLLREEEEKLAQAREKAKQIAQNEFSLMERLAGAQGNDELVKRLQRENELRNAADALTRSYLLQIYAAEDLASSNAAAIAAQQEDEAKLKAIADERYGLETRLLNLQGDTAALRQRELDALDPANRALLQMIFNLEDAKTAADAAAQAAADMAAKQKEISDEINGLNRQWLELTGQTQVLRDMDLELLKSDEARALQQRIWDYQDALERQKAAQEAATAAMDAYNQRLEDARNTLVSAYERESGALQQTIDKFRDFSASIKEFRDSLVAQNSPAFGLAQAQARFANTSAMARLGNEASLSSFTSDAQAYLDAARSGGTFEQYQRALASVLSGSSNAMKGADGVANMAQRQLDRMTGIMETLGLMREDEVSFNQALADYNKALTEDVVPYFAETVGSSIDDLAEQVAIGNATSAENGEVTKVTLETLVMAMNRVSRILDRAERDGSSLAVTLDGETIKAIIEGTVPVNVTNTPLPVDQVP